HFGNKIYIRGLIEISSYCKNDCYYCGLRCSNKNAQRYRLTKEDILLSCKIGYDLGFKTFVLQGGEDNHFTDELICDIVKTIKSEYPDVAVTLSLGEKEKSSYEKYRNAGADRYLLRHETSDKEHYKKLHPEKMSIDDRKKCLENLKALGYQTGCGIMVGSPYQTIENIADDLIYIHDFSPQMVGIGPFIPHKDTPFANEKTGNVKLTLFLLSIIRIMEKKVLLPATTALSTADENGREEGILSGANVIMPNLSPVDVRKKYMLYDNKLCTDEEAAESINKLKERIKSVGYEIVTDRGDYRG
ncbi:MAG: [Clostridia bacterium]|nr:[FeFe] hydrogenase H-cluster radical SAM maturase HydE [Clostridia bacterium]